MNAVLVVACCKTNGARSQARRLPIDGEVDLPYQHREHLFVYMFMRRMRRSPGRQLCFMHFQRYVMVQIPLEHRSRLIDAAGPAGFHRELLEGICLRRNVACLR